MTDCELNIFVENICEELPENLELRKVSDNLKSMTRYFLSKKEWLNKSCLEGYDFETLSFDIVLCDNKKIHDINREYRDIDRPTDVITFAIFADSEEEERFIFDNEINLGEIIISLDKTQSQAAENGQSFENELYFLLAHGILHLMGYDHQTEETLCEMWDMQKKICLDCLAEK